MSDTNALPMGFKEHVCSFKGPLDAEDLEPIIGVKKKTIYKMARQGSLPGYRVGTLVKFNQRALCDWYDQQKLG